MGTGKKLDVVIGTSRSATGACTFLSMRRTFILVEKRCLQTNMTKTTGFSVNCYAAKVTDDGYATLVSLIYKWAWNFRRDGTALIIIMK